VEQVLAMQQAAAIQQNRSISTAHQYLKATQYYSDTGQEFDIMPNIRSLLHRQDVSIC
jgi:hypothetical protein